MLPPFIIEKLRERERALKENGKHQHLELELPLIPLSPPEIDAEGEKRGVVEIPIWAP